MTTPRPKKTPLNDWHRAHGARMVEFAGWDMPLQYATGILREHLATRKFGGLFDVTHMARFSLRGRNVVSFLQHVLSNNAEALDLWEAQYTLLPTPTGGVLDDAYLYRFESDGYLLVVNAANREKDWVHLQEKARAFPGVILEDLTEALGMIAVQGAMSRPLLESCLEGGTLPRPFRNALAEARMAGTIVRISRTGYTGEPIGYELFVPSDRLPVLWTELYEKGQAFGVIPAGLGARDTLRLEASLPLYGHEYGQDADGREIPVFAVPVAAVAVSFSKRKGTFIGRGLLERQGEALKMWREGRRPPPSILDRMIRPVALLDRGVARPGDIVLAQGKPIGTITSGTTVPYWIFEGQGATIRITDRSDRRALALAYLDAEWGPGHDVHVRVRDHTVRAQIVRWHGRSDAPPYFRPIPVGVARPSREPAEGDGWVRARILLRRALDNHVWRQHHCINLIPSEMTPSPLVRLLQVSDPAGRYAEHKEFLACFEQEVFYYQGTEFIAWVEERLAAELGRFLGCSQIEARAISGQMANMIVFSALVDHKNRLNRRQEAERIRLVVTHHIANGGHLSAQPMGALRDYVAKDPVTERYAVLHFPVCRDNRYRIDLAATAEMLDRVDPELIIFGKSLVLHPEPLAEVRRMVQGKPHPPLMLYDMAHVLGLAGPHFQEPFREGADVVTASTHKTFFGTQRGIVAMNAAEGTPAYEYWKAIRRRAFPGMVSNHHLGSLVGLLLAAIEMNTFRDQYQPQVMANAKAFARALKEQGLDVQGDPAVGYTQTHQVIVRVGYGQACEIARRLEKNNIIVNYQAIPGDEGFTASSALRLGVAEMTRFGMKEKDFAAFAVLLADAVRGRPVAAEVAAFRAPFQTLHYCFDGSALAAEKERLLRTF